MHIIPFNGRNHSGTYNLNLLWNSGPIYLMDNHRAALWAWAQKLNLNEKHSIIHIDRHYDTLSSNINLYCKGLIDISDYSIDQYKDHTTIIEKEDRLTFRWDNYLSIHNKIYGKNLNDFHVLTHKDGDPPALQHRELNIIDVLENLSFWINAHDNWIFNFDIDYIYAVYDNEFVQIISDEFIRKLFMEVSTLLKSGKIKVVTICLTPDYYTPGWGDTLRISNLIFDALSANHPNI